MQVNPMDMMQPQSQPQGRPAMSREGMEIDPYASEQNDGFMDPQEPTPEEEEQHKQFMGQALSLMYDEKMLPRLREVLTGGGQGGDPAQGLAMAASMITARVALAGEKNGVEIMPDVVFASGKEILEDLAEFSRKAGIKDYSEDPEALERAYFMALDQFRIGMQQMGRGDQEAAKAEMGRIIQMDEEGRFETKLRELMTMQKRRDAEGQAQGGGLMREAGSEKAMPRARGLMSAA